MARPELLALLGSPWADRVVAVVAVLPFAYALRHQFLSLGFNAAWLSLDLNAAALILTMLVRRPPMRVTPNPIYWLLTLVASYWFFATGRLMERGHLIAPPVVVAIISLVSVGVLLWARLSLGRNIGFVPAQRQIVTNGAYRFMRHPIYTGVFLSSLAVLLASFSAWNAFVCGFGCLLFVIKSFVEEQFLRDDPEYAAYLRQVRWRWFPGVA